MIDVVGIDALEARLLARRGRFEEAERLARKACAAAEKTNFLLTRRLAGLSLVTVLELKGEPEEARRELERLLALFEAKWDVVMAGRLKERLGELLHAS